MTVRTMGVYYLPAWKTMHALGLERIVYLYQNLSWQYQPDILIWTRQCTDCEKALTMTDANTFGQEYIINISTVNCKIDMHKMQLHFISEEASSDTLASKIIT